MSKTYVYYVESIEPSGDCGMYRAIISTANHGACIEIVQENITSLVLLTASILAGLNKLK
jgi:hypothetical protein